MQGCEASTAPRPTMPHLLLSFRNSISCKGLKAVRGNSEMGKKRGPCLVISSPESPGAPGQKLLSLEWVQVCLPLDFSVLSSSHLSSEHGDGLGNGFLSAQPPRPGATLPESLPSGDTAQVISSLAFKLHNT